MARAPGLDLLRAIAILWVMYSHAQVFNLVSDDDPVASFGWMGVDLFFALSGFLIGGQLFRPITAGEPVRVGRFYVRRLFRTAPAYLVVLALYFTIPAFSERPGLAPLWQYLTFTQNFFGDFQHRKAFSHVWSLCVEEQFYLIAPIAVLLLARVGRWSFWLTIAALVIAGVALRSYIWIHDLGPLRHGGAPGAFTNAWIDRIYFSTWTRLDGLLAGLSFALVRATKPRVWAALTARANGMLLAGLAGVGVAIWLFRDQRGLVASVIGYPILSFSMASLVVAGASASGLIGRRTVPGAALIAAMAYSLYLTHKEIYHLVLVSIGPALAGRPMLGAFVYATAILACGGLLYACVERPFLRLRDRFGATPRRTAPDEMPTDQSPRRLVADPAA